LFRSTALQRSRPLPNRRSGHPLARWLSGRRRESVLTFRHSTVPAQMWQWRAWSRCRYGTGEPSPGADVAAVSPVLVQMWHVSRSLPEKPRCRNPRSYEEAPELSRLIKPRPQTDRSTQRSWRRSDAAQQCPCCGGRRSSQHVPSHRHTATGMPCAESDARAHTRAMKADRCTRRPSRGGRGSTATRRGSC
jgi:hypothetical protein